MDFKDHQIPMAVMGRIAKNQIRLPRDPSKEGDSTTL